MKPKLNQTTLQSEGVQNSVSFGIKDSGLAHVFGILRNQLYSDKILAVVREYSCNAVDAHVEAGHGERPIEVTIPTKLKLEFKVRDFGPALSADEIKDVYAFYGESTKRNTNDQIGMLGIGSKSAFAYGDNFIINSYLNGTKHIWNAFIDPSQIGQISKIGEEPTDEENGIEIVVPVKEEDVNEFQTKARDLFRYFKVVPEIKGAAQPEYSDKPVLFEGESWMWYKSTRSHHYAYGRNGSAVAIMGNIGYEFDSGDLNLTDEQREDGIDNLICNNLHIKFNIGDLEISASREKLQFTDATRAAVTKKLEQVKTELIGKAQETFKDCKTLWAAKGLLADVSDYSSGLYELRDVIVKNVKWKGKDIGETSVRAPEKVAVAQIKKPNRGIRYRIEDGYGTINAGSETVVVENDLETRRAIIGRLLGLAIEEKKNVYLVEYENAKAKKEWLKIYDGELLKLSDLEKRPLTDFYGFSTNGGSVAHCPKHAKKLNSSAFEFDFTSGDAYVSRNSDYFKAADVDLDGKGVYVIIDRFQLDYEGLSGYYGSNPNKILTYKELCEKAGIKFPKRVYAWKTAKKDTPKKAKGFVTLWDYIKAELKKVLKKGGYEQKWVDRRHSLENSAEWHSVAKLDDAVKLLVADDSRLARNVKEWKRLLHKDDAEKLDSVKEIAEKVGVELNFKLEPSFDLKNDNKEIEDKYEMLTLVDWYKVKGFRADTDKEKLKDRKKLINYINVIDVCDTSR